MLDRKNEGRLGNKPAFVVLMICRGKIPTKR